MRITLLTGKTFDLENAFDFAIKINISKQAKRLTLRIDAKEKLPVLTLPPRCSRRKAYEFVMEHKDWIKNNLAKLPQAKFFEDGEQISVMGKLYQISHQPARRGGVFIEEDKLVVCGEKEFLHRRMVDFLKQVAKKELMALSKKMAGKISRDVKNVTIKDTKSRWGSCSNRGNINYNWRIVLAPKNVISYLVAHEVSHLAHQDHSADFWSCVEGLNPAFEENRHWLKVRGKMLYLYV